MKQYDEYELKLIEWLKTFKNRQELVNYSNKTYVSIFTNFLYLLEEALPVKNWSLEKCKLDALNYNTKKEWRQGSSAYPTALKNNWLEQCCSHMESRFWTLEKCKKDALKYKTRNEWQVNSNSAYCAARKRSWLEECCKHMEHKLNYWTLEKCKKDASKYKTRREWEVNSSGYQAAIRNKWQDICCIHMEYKSLDLETCKKESIKYDTKKEWHASSRPTYSAAYRNNWLDQCCGHMKASRTSKKKIKCSNEQTYESITAAALELNLHGSNISHVLNGKYKSTGGYTFVYVEEEND